MRDWFDALAARERLFVSTGAVIVVLALIYGLGWAPLEQKHSALKADVEIWQRSLAQLRPLRVATVSSEQSAATPANRSQLSPILIVDQTLRNRGLDQYRRRSQPTTSNGIRIEFEDIAFDELVLWLGDLSGQYAMHVQMGSLSVGSQSAPGRINATLTLERAL